jgi:hypothetical protein
VKRLFSLLLAHNSFFRANLTGCWQLGDSDFLGSEPKVRQYPKAGPSEGVSRFMRMRQNVDRLVRTWRTNEYDERGQEVMPTLPTKSLFDKDLSLRSPFPRHISLGSHPSVDPDPLRASHEEARQVDARSDYRQIKRPTPVKAKPSPSVFDLQLPQSDVPHSLRNLVHFSVWEKSKLPFLLSRKPNHLSGQMPIDNWIECITLVLCQKYRNCQNYAKGHRL